MLVKRSLMDQLAGFSAQLHATSRQRRLLPDKATALQTGSSIFLTGEDECLQMQSDVAVNILAGSGVNLISIVFTRIGEWGSI